MRSVRALSWKPNERIPATSSSARRISDSSTVQSIVAIRKCCSALRALGMGTAAVGAQAPPGAQQSWTAAGVNAGAGACGFSESTEIILVGATQDKPALQQSSVAVPSRFSDFIP